MSARLVTYRTVALGIRGGNVEMGDLGEDGIGKEEENE